MISVVIFPIYFILNIYFSSISLLESPHRFTTAKSITFPSERQSFQNRRHIGGADVAVHRHSMFFSYLDVRTILPARYLSALKKRRFLQFKEHASYPVGVTGFEPDKHNFTETAYFQWIFENGLNPGFFIVSMYNQSQLHTHFCIQKQDYATRNATRIFYHKYSKLSMSKSDVRYSWHLHRTSSILCMWGSEQTKRPLCSPGRA